MAGHCKIQRAIEAAALAAKTAQQVAAKPQPTGKAAPPQQAVLSFVSSQVAALPPLPPPGASSFSLRPYRPLFAPGYNDLILRSYSELPVWENYLRENPRRLMMKRARPEWLRPYFLSAWRRLAVRVSRRLTNRGVECEPARYLESAQRSACCRIATGMAGGCNKKKWKKTKKRNARFVNFGNNSYLCPPR